MQIATGGTVFFDSGVGGLTVLNACVRTSKETIFYYYGDNEHAPYGNLSGAQVFARTRSAFDLFHVLQPSAVVIACNTATAHCVSALRKIYPFPIIGAEPALLPACACGGRVLVLATVATCKSEKFIRLCRLAKEKYPAAEIVIHPCPQLAGVIEGGGIFHDFDLSIHIPTMQVSSVVLGCTHYIYIKERIKSWYNCQVFDGNLGISTRLSTVFAQGKEGDLSTKKGGFIHIDEKSRDKQPLFSTANLFCEKEKKIYFLGPFAHKNRTFYEQTFAIPGK